MALIFEDRPEPAERSEVWFRVMDSMYYVYVLRSFAQEKFYIGYTQDLERRLAEHRRGQCHTTCRMNSPELLFYEAFLDQKDAVRRERYFKTSKGKKTLRLMLRESLKDQV